MTKIIKMKNSYTIPDLVIVSFKAVVLLTTEITDIITPDLYKIENPMCDLDVGDPKKNKIKKAGEWWHLNEGNSKRGKIKKVGEKWHIVTRKLTLSYGKQFRKIVLEKIGLQRMPSAIFEQKDNSLTATCVKLCKQNGLRLDKMTEELYLWGEKQVRKAIEDMVSDYYDQFKYEIKKDKIKTSIKCAEICTDFLGPRHIQLARQKGFCRAFDEVVHNNEITYFDKSGRKHVTSKAGVVVGEGSKEVKYLRGYLDDKSILKAYLKSIDKFGAMNRVETRFDPAALKKILGSSQIFYYVPEEVRLTLTQQLKKLTVTHKQRVCKIIQRAPLYKKPKLKARIKMAVYDYCGKFSPEIFQSLSKWGVVATGKKSPLTKGAQRRIRYLSCRNELFLKSGCSIYQLDKKWFKKNY